MSPEQVRGRDVDCLSDVFSLGVSLYEMATRRRPFVGANRAETMHLILHAQPEPITGLHGGIAGELERIIFKCVEKDREHRYQSTRELRADLQHVSDEIARGVEETRRSNLPALLTSFVGRRQEIDEIRRLLGTSRLLTLTGAGGCGKTRLALQVASELPGEFRDGIWAVDLGPVSEPGLVANSVSATVGIREGSYRPLTTRSGITSAHATHSSCSTTAST